MPRTKKAPKRDKKAPTSPRTPSPTARTVRLPYPQDPLGNPLCRWCLGPVTPPRKSWCGDRCVHEYRERYDSAYQRRILLGRDKGVCQMCGLDTLGLGRRTLAAYRAHGEDAAQTVLVEAGLRASDLRFKGWRKDRLRPLWDSDHIVPVSEGGGGSTTDNLRTLCKACHRTVTRDLMARRRAAALGAKKTKGAQGPDPKSR